MTNKSEYRFPLRIYYEDTDAGGIVYHSNYLKYMERGRSDFISDRLQTSFFAYLKEAGVQFVVASLSIDYRKPAVLGDDCTVCTRVTERRGASIEFAQSVWRAETLLCDATVQVVCCDATGKPCRIPNDLRNLL